MARRPLTVERSAEACARLARVRLVGVGPAAAALAGLSRDVLARAPPDLAVVVRRVLRAVAIAPERSERLVATRWSALRGLSLYPGDNRTGGEGP